MNDLPDSVIPVHYRYLGLTWRRNIRMQLALDHKKHRQNEQILSNMSLRPTSYWTFQNSLKYFFKHCWIVKAFKSFETKNGPNTRWRLPQSPKAAADTSGTYFQQKQIWLLGKIHHVVSKHKSCPEGETELTPLHLLSLRIDLALLVVINT